MQMTIESSSEIITYLGVKCRIWRGKTKRGVEVYAFIPLVAHSREADAAEFEHDLKEKHHDAFGTHFDMRNVL